MDKLNTYIVKKLRTIEKRFGFENEVKWGTVFVIFAYHALAVSWCYKYTFPAKWQTVAFAYFMYALSGTGITAGVHRYWSHRSFKATRPLQILLFLFLFAASGQTSVLRFVRNHRLHHKCSDTEADPHNADRGLFFSHIGWLMLKKNPETVRRGKQIDVSDIESDPLLMWHERNVFLVNLVCSFIVPTLVNVWLWGETWWCAVAWQCFIRYLVVLHFGMTVNSLAHKFGHKPFNKTIKPAENILVSIATLGEGFHNYHHAFPFDYKATDRFYSFNSGTMMIKLCEKLGLAYDLREASPEMINSMSERLGDKFQVKEGFNKE